MGLFSCLQGRRRVLSSLCLLQEADRCTLANAVVAGSGVSALSCPPFSIVWSRYALGCELEQQAWVPTLSC